LTMRSSEMDRHQIRTIKIDGEKWFIARDVITALGFSGVSSAIKSKCPAARKYPVVSGRQVHQMVIIDEQDVNRLIMASGTPAAAVFRELLT
jgi:prophage antirepressor-like protein